MSAGVITLGELAEGAGARLLGDASVEITGAAPIEDAGPGEITFISEKKYLDRLATTGASAVIVDEEAAAGHAGARPSLLVASNPQLAFAKVLGVLRPPRRPPAGIHPRAEVHPGANLGEGVSIGPFAVVEEGARIGDRAVLYPGVYVAAGAAVGADSVLHAGVAVREGCLIGRRVTIHCNSVVGSDGFGYARDGEAYVKIPQTGIVRVEDDVEIGACTTVDRATLGQTVIGRGTKIDNLVQIAHNVRVGEHTVMAAQVGIAGSTTVGDGVQLGGQVGVAGHVNIGDRVMAGAKSGVHGNVPAGEVLSGYPAIPHNVWLKSSMVMPRLPELRKKIRELEKRIAEMEEGG